VFVAILMVNILLLYVQ